LFVSHDVGVLILVLSEVVDFEQLSGRPCCLRLEETVIRFQSPLHEDEHPDRVIQGDSYPGYRTNIE
jgi:hypothetical protein